LVAKGQLKVSSHSIPWAPSLRARATTLSRLRAAIAGWLRRIVIWPPTRSGWQFRARHIPLRTMHFELSVVSPLLEAAGGSSAELFELGLRAVRGAPAIDLRKLHERSMEAREHVSVFPGEHYRLLASLVRCIEPTQVLEIGTYTGLSALAMLTTLGTEARLTTFDIVPWRQIPTTALREDDFADGRLEQRVGDLAQVEFFRQNRDVILASELIFVDGPKDGRFEPAFVRQLLAMQRKERCVLFFDDIRLWNMLGVWADLPLPKQDLTSFGHWTGSGICRLEATTKRSATPASSNTA
jgi:predicted O-methyltransferase YrrM